MGAFLAIGALPGLKKYKYAGEDRSLVSRYVLKPFYTTIVEFLPRWLAPNMVTLLGLMFSLDSFLRATKYGLQAGTKTPTWVYVAHAVELFLYQTLDALDGQQARRTGTSSPLGELFDHCVDAINTSLQAYVVCSVIQLPPNLTIATELLCTINFFLSTWEEYHTHKLFLSVVSGPVEGILMCCAMELATAALGPQIWTHQLLAWNNTTFGEFHALTVLDVVVYSMTFGLVVNAVMAAVNVHNAFATHRQFLQALWGLAPFVTMWIGFGTWFYLDRGLLMSSKVFLPFFLTIAFIFALLVGRVITAHVTAQRYPMWTPMLIVPFLGVLSFYHCDFFKRVIVVCSLATFSLGVYACFVAEIISEITEYLDINCLTIKKPHQE